ncbi:MAG: hypothetical protein ACKPHU_28895, partial [Planctomycetaceae bacterium]
MVTLLLSGHWRYALPEPSFLVSVLPLRRVYKCLQGAGESLPYSVFRCELSAEERQGLIERLWGLMNLREDRLLVANLGVSDGRGSENLQYWGIPRELPDST